MEKHIFARTQYRRLTAVTIPLLMLFTPVTQAAWTYDCVMANGDVMITGSTFTLGASAEASLWVNQVTIDKNRIAKTADSQAVVSATVNDDVIKNAVGNTFAKIFINGRGGSQSFIRINIDPVSFAVQNCEYTLPGIINAIACPTISLNQVSFNDLTGTAQSLNTLLFSTLGFNGSGTRATLSFPVPPPDEFRDHTMSWTLGPVVQRLGYTGGITVSAPDINTESSAPFPSVTCTRQATPVVFTMTPDTLDFSDVPAGGTQAITRPLTFTVTTSPATLPAATLTFSNPNVEDGKLELNGGKVSFRRDADALDIRMNEPFAVSEKMMNFTVTLDPSAAKPGSATTNMLVTLAVN